MYRIWISYVACASILCLLPVAESLPKGNCELFNSSFIENAISAGELIPASPTNVSVFNMTFVCLSVGDTKDRYSFASVIVNFTSDSESGIYQFEVACTEIAGESSWNTDILDGVEALKDPDDALWASETATSCKKCIGGSATETLTHCLPCDSSANCTGSSYCYEPKGSAGTVCCPYYDKDNGSCIAACPDDYAPDGSFTCSVCDYPCSPGEIADSNCTSCILQDICLFDPPCENNGACEINDSPSNYTCTCPYPYYEENCSMMCSCPVNQECVIVVGLYQCQCAGNWTGENCTECSIPDCMVCSSEVNKCAKCEVSLAGDLCEDCALENCMFCSAGSICDTCVGNWTEESNCTECELENCKICSNIIDECEECHVNWREPPDCDTCNLDKCLVCSEEDYVCDECIGNWTGADCGVCTLEGSLSTTGGLCPTDPCGSSPCPENSTCSAIVARMDIDYATDTYQCVCDEGFHWNNQECKPNRNWTALIVGLVLGATLVVAVIVAAVIMIVVAYNCTRHLREIAHDQTANQQQAIENEPLADRQQATEPEPLADRQQATEPEPPAGQQRTFCC